jgi:hypothetical protein
MSKTIEVPQNLGDTIKMIADFRRTAAHAKTEVYPAAGAATEQVSHAYHYASDAGPDGDIETSAQAGPLRTTFAEIGQHLSAIYGLLGEAQVEVKKAVQAMDEADKRRAEARRKLSL